MTEPLADPLSGAAPDPPVRSARLPFTDPRAFVPFALVALIWGSTWVVIKDQLGTVPPSWSIAYRFVLASAAMLVLLRIRGERLRVSRAAWPVVAVIALAQFVINFHFVYRAEIALTSGVVALFFALIMVPNAILARLLLGERAAPGFVAGSLVAIAGVALLMIHESRIGEAGAATASGMSVTLGAALAALAVLAASVANVAQATERAHAEPLLPLLALAMLVGAGVDILLAFAIDGPPVWDPRPAYVIGIAYLGLVGSVVTFPLYFLLIRNMGAGRAAYVGVVTPVLAMVLSTLFEGYRWGVLAVAGSLLALAGLLVALKARN